MPLDEEQRKQRALDCRKIRMFIASHPHLTMEQIMRRTGTTDPELFWRMEGMGIIERLNSSDPRRNHTWRVVPQ